ncbi:uncharacterized protein LOC127241161 [Andrographis paniculata]|uniref:uncharacterized protein LOC127241161 n=1 Tax=Andrographis paniculata TaxID=175694 RepID=UPI0021E96806|nr:uncharacterized protein LOC127241161 [Andrographis paniculata]XP_051116048.1 uncharacterized protein LOC127241161 [Andrographis paniculata]
MAGSASASALSFLWRASVDCRRISMKSGVSSTSEKRFSFACFSSKKKKIGFMDQILDYIEGGPKLRKWYGAPDLMQEDENELDQDEVSEEEVRDAVLVTDGDSEIGQMIILALIVKKVRIKALVKDKRVTMEAFGTYVESLVGDAKDRAFFKKALQGVRVVICPTEGFLCNIDNWKGIRHVILLSQLSVYRDYTGIQAVINKNSRNVAEQDENAVKSSGIPYTIIRTGVLKNTPGGEQGFNFKEGSAAKGSLSKGDAALICVEALDNVPQKGLTFEVVNGDEKVSDWKKSFTTLMDEAAQ